MGKIKATHVATYVCYACCHNRCLRWLHWVYAQTRHDGCELILLNLHVLSLEEARRAT